MDINLISSVGPSHLPPASRQQYQRFARRVGRGATASQAARSESLRVDSRFGTYRVRLSGGHVLFCKLAGHGKEQMLNVEISNRV